MVSPQSTHAHNDTCLQMWKSMSPEAHHRRRRPPPPRHFDFTPVFVLRAVANGGCPLITFMCKFPSTFIVNICAKLFTFFLLSSWLVCCASENARNLGNANYDASAIPKLDVNDLANLIEMFPEFREYVYQALASHVQQIQTTPVPPTATPPNNISENVMQIWGNWQKNALSSLLPVANSPVSSAGLSTTGEKVNSRKDSSSYAFYGSGVQPEVKDVRASSKHSSYHGYYPPQQEYGYGHHYKDHHHNYYPQKAASHSHHNHHGWGWSNEGHTDPKFHYEVGYELGKDLSCLFGLFGFKSLKDLTLFSFFSFFKKLKYMALIGLAFKLGVFLSPVALPLLFPVIILAVIAKVLPLLLIIVLLFKLLKAQFKLKGVGREDYYGGGAINSILEGTHISRLWQNIEEAQERIGVVQSEGEACVEKIICTINERGPESGEGRGFPSDFLVNEVLPTLPRILSWVYPTIQWRRGEINSDSKQNKDHVNEDERMFVCEKIQCSPNRRKLKNSEETLEESTTLLP